MNTKDQEQIIDQEQVIDQERTIDQEPSPAQEQNNNQESSEAPQGEGKIIRIVGSGLAGSEAALTLAKAGYQVDLYEQKPTTYSPAHHLPGPGELVCSNSLKSQYLHAASGLLKAELLQLGSTLLPLAFDHQVPAGQALAIDREGFSKALAEIMKTYPNLHYHEGEITEIKDLLPQSEEEYLLLATGPLTSDALCQEYKTLFDLDDLFFFDAAAPLVEADSIDQTKAFWASRYGDPEEETGDYLNCPLDEETYQKFYTYLRQAPQAPVKDFDQKAVFEGCLPIEVIASRGPETLRHGPLKPVGLIDPKTGKEPYAVVQLRQDNQAANLLGMVGFQTRLTYEAQKELFSMIPALASAQYSRFGLMHKNRYLNSPKHLDLNYHLKNQSNVYFIGQISGTEGYVEAISSGLLAALSVMKGDEAFASSFYTSTITGALSRYVSQEDPDHFAPMKGVFGLLSPVDKAKTKRIMGDHNLAYQDFGKKSFRLVLVLRSLLTVATWANRHLDLSQAKLATAFRLNYLYALWAGIQNLTAQKAANPRMGRHRKDREAALAPILKQDIREIWQEEKATMLKSSYAYSLDPARIAQHPTEQRDICKLMVLEAGKTSHHAFYEIGKFLQAGDLLVVNNTKVIPARLHGRKATGTAAVELLLLRREEGTKDDWQVIGKPGKNLQEGDVVTFGEGKLDARVLQVLPNGNRLVRFQYDGIWEEVLAELGEMPVPPYITEKLKNPDDYNTVYAKFDGSAAAPTAGLHFTTKLLEDLQKEGIKLAEITLHVGIGTFRPVKTDDILDHDMHKEYYEVNEEAVRLINETVATGGRIIAVGTTSCRTLETIAQNQHYEKYNDQGELGQLQAEVGESQLFIYPGFSFRLLDGLITNFHLPESTLLMLVSAFYGRKRMLAAYEEAIAKDYRFFSFGDAMLILPEALGNGQARAKAKAKEKTADQAQALVAEAEKGE